MEWNSKFAQKTLFSDKCGWGSVWRLFIRAQQLTDSFKLHSAQNTVYKDYVQCNVQCTVLYNKVQYRLH